ncbi:MAG: hypothetical protein ISEC1_P1788 [Thiomicrorhabdus sp.]|nr:MAG: hypothetical protein ISEC1_P1788 [Thiomicrorhabdus sp.]
MARDYRHGHASKQGFQRKSQQGGAEEEKRSVSLVWSVGFFLSALLLVGLFTFQNFSFNSVAPSKLVDADVFQSTVELKQVAIESIEKISEQLQPRVELVNEVVIPTSQVQKTPIELKQNFSFYQGLSQTEVVVEAEPISVQMKHPYYIQAGSFGSESVAKQELKRLARRGQVLELSVLHKGSRTYYRLRAGPYTDRLQMNKRRNELRRFGVDTLLIKASVKSSDQVNNSNK